MCGWCGFARGSVGHLLNFPNQIYAAHCCVSGVALQEIGADIFKIFQTKYMLAIYCAGGVALLGAGAAFCAFRFSPGLNKENTQLDRLKTF